MSTTNPEPGAPNAGDPQAGDPTPTPTTAPAPVQTPAPNPDPVPVLAPPPAATPTPTPVQTFDAGYVSALRNEAADYRVKHKEAADKLTETTTQLAELQTQIRNTHLQLAINAAETKVVDAAAALALIDQSKIKFDASGKPENLNELLRELVGAKPYLTAGPGVPTTPASNPARPGQSFTVEQIQAMSQAEINANWDAVQEVLKGR
jgi:hypothetical protein